MRAFTIGWCSTRRPPARPSTSSAHPSGSSASSTAALQVQDLLRSPQTLFVLVSGPGSGRVADTLFFARRLTEAGYNLGPIVVNRVHPLLKTIHPAIETEGHRLLSWLGRRDHEGVAELRDLVGDSHPVVEFPLLADEPTNLKSLSALGELFETRLGEAINQR